jgi:hypothetical protein
MLAHNGVPANHRHIAAVFHQGGGDAVFTNDGSARKSIRKTCCPTSRWTSG